MKLARGDEPATTIHNIQATQLMERRLHTSLLSSDVLSQQNTRYSILAVGTRREGSLNVHSYHALSTMNWTLRAIQR